MSIEIINKCQRGEDLTWQEYCSGASRTLSDAWHGDKYPAALAVEVIQHFIEAGNLLDGLKKALYYGKNTEAVACDHRTYIHTYRTDEPLADFAWDIDHDTRLILHAALGVATEAVEILEAVKKTLTTGEPLDTVNLAEEVGDTMWYFAILFSLKLPGFSDLNPILRTNLLKLYARYGEKFTSERAINRDLQQEHQILVRGEQ